MYKACRTHAQSRVYDPAKRTSECFKANESILVDNATAATPVIYPATPDRPSESW